MDSLIIILLFVSTAMSAIVFFFLINLIYKRRWEQTLAASLYAFLHRGAGGRQKPEIDTPPEEEEEEEEEALKPDASAGEQSLQPITSAGLTAEEVKVALLLIDGVTQRDICRKLNINASVASYLEKAIRQKLNLISDPDPVIAAVTAEYKLTKRETQMLRYLRNNTGNDEIAAELYLSEETVKGHVRNLLMKLAVEKRHNITDWLDEYGRKLR